MKDSCSIRVFVFDDMPEFLIYIVPLIIVLLAALGLKGMMNDRNL
jgi:hypothetical protein